MGHSRFPQFSAENFLRRCEVFVCVDVEHWKAFHCLVQYPMMLKSGPSGLLCISTKILESKKLTGLYDDTTVLQRGYPNVN